ncbi:hypothetical protein [Cohnella yongneupensis]|uniref:Cthe-2314-like HEPN domain-containing protein n=1 Tax=Cohnella yongneupensis TaxID=425006 RepID=A0ABW0QYC7_9BACL
MRLGIEFIEKTEYETIHISRSYLKGIHENVPNIIDTTFKLAYFTGDLGNVETPEGTFLSICKITYMQAPYTFWALYNLYEKGYYLEAINLYRHLIEAFIQLRYFYKYPSKLEEHIKQTKRINFSAMFNEFSAGYYKRYYSNQLSEAAHGFIFKHMHRVDLDPSGKRRTVMGSQFDVDRATYVINNTIPLLFGFINWFPKFFNNNNLDDETKCRITESISWLEIAMASHKRANTGSMKWYEHMDKFIQ